jgi:hypothetical protein
VPLHSVLPQGAKNDPSILPELDRPFQDFIHVREGNTSNSLISPGKHQCYIPRTGRNTVKLCKENGQVRAYQQALATDSLDRIIRRSQQREKKRKDLLFSSCNPHSVSLKELDMHFFPR